MAMNRPPSRPPSAPATGWEITDQVQATDVDAKGVPARGMRVYFRTGKGVTSNVFVPDSRYSVENVQAAVASKAAEIDQVHGLQG
jgi:hypothetical protein